MIKTIELSGFFDIQRKLQEKVTAAERELYSAQAALRESDANSYEVVVARLENGQTTGDCLQNEAIRALQQLDKGAIDKILAFNRRLVEGKDQEVLIVFQYQKPAIQSSRPEDDQTHEAKGYIFGILSGERFELGVKPWQGPPAPSAIILPLKRSLKWGFGDMGEYQDLRSQQITEKNMILSGDVLCNEPSAHSFLWEIIGTALETKVSVFIGKEIDGQTLLLPSMGLDDARKILHASDQEPPESRCEI